MDKGERVSAIEVDTGGAMGINSRGGLAQTARVVRERINARHMSGGVTIVDPDTTYIDADVRIGRDTLIHPMTFLSGVTTIGAGCEIGPSTRIVDTTVRAGALVQFSVIRASRIGADAVVGPFAHLRAGTVLGAGAKAGAFVEIKASQLAEGAKVPHLSYVGDASIGRRANVGAGTVTVNYDGYRKHRTVVGGGARGGSGTMLVAPGEGGQGGVGWDRMVVEPVKGGEGAVRGAGSVITKDVPAGALGVERSEQRTIRRYRERKDAEARGRDKGAH